MIYEFWETHILRTNTYYRSSSFFSIRTSRDLAAEEARRKQRIHSELQCRHFIEHTRRGETTVGKKETHQIALEDNLLIETHKQGTAACKGEEAN
jgi:hypothetical protein